MPRSLPWSPCMRERREHVREGPSHQGIAVREYGSAGPTVVILHGGPGAAGYMAPVARALSRDFRVLEPLQRASGGEPLTVARHVADLREVIRSRCGAVPPALVGHSWGAMLALACAAAHPGDSRCLALIGCGTFDPGSRSRLRERLERRMDENLRRRISRLEIDFPHPDERLRAAGDLLLPAYSHDPMTDRLEVESCDARAHQESWADMLRLESEGIYPAAFKAISAPVLMLHGEVDPHPGGEVRASLQPHLPQLQYHESPRCGHYPWIEREVHEDFFSLLREWLHERSAEGLHRRR